MTDFFLFVKKRAEALYGLEKKVQYNQMICEIKKSLYSVLKTMLIPVFLLPWILLDVGNVSVIMQYHKLLLIFPDC